MFWMVQQLTSSMGLIKNTHVPHIGPIGTDGHKPANNTGLKQANILKLKHTFH